MPDKIMLDTNVLLSYHSKALEQYKKVYIPTTVLEELDKLKMSDSEEKKFKARQAIRALEEADNVEYILDDSLDMTKADNKILKAAQDNGCKLITQDINMRVKANALELSVDKFNSDIQEEYKGYKEVILSEYELATFYECQVNKWGLLLNEYLIIKDSDGNLVDKLKWTNKGFRPIIRKNLKSVIFEDLKPKDVYQELCIDSLVSDQFTIITGKAGSGKSLLSLMYCLWAIQTQKYDKIIIMYNPTKVRGAVNMGFYSGNSLEKGLQQFIGNMLNTKFGDKMIVNNYIAQDKIQLVPMADCRGMEVTDSQILYIPEAQNTSSDLMKICLSRVAKDAKCIIEGDHINQVDMRHFENNNGLLRTIEIFKGFNFVSYVHLNNVWRSKIAEIADLL